VEIKPNDTITVDFSWDQKDKDGKQVPPGWYNIIFTNTAFSQGDMTIGINLPARVLIQYPRGVIEKSLDLNQSQTVNGITVTLERIELTSSGMRVYALAALSGYPVPPGITSTTYAIMQVFAGYSIDGSVVKQAGSAGMQFLENGTRLIWSGHIDPVPNDAKELVFRVSKIILSFAPDRPDEKVTGPWEFRIPLD